MAETKIGIQQVGAEIWTANNNPIISEGVPTVNTEATAVGQRYLNSTTNEEYICTSLTDGEPTLNYTIVGSNVSVSNDYIASGFTSYSASDYLDTTFTFSPSLPWEVKAKVVITDGNIYNWNTIIGGKQDCKFGVFLGMDNGSVNNQNKSFQFECSYNSTIWDVNLKSRTNLSLNIPYYIKAGWTGSLYYLDISTDGETYTRDDSLESSTRTVATQPICFGKCPFTYNSGFPGTIDLKAVKFYENNELVFEPVVLGNGPAWKKVQPVAGENLLITNSSTEQTISAPDMLKNTATGTNSTTLLGTVASSSNATNIGISSAANANATALGYNANANNYATAIGAYATGSGYSVAIYSAADANTKANASTGSVAIGPASKATGNSSIAIGDNPTASYNSSIAIGDHTQATATSSIAIGKQAVASAENAIQIGQGTNSVSGTVQIKSTKLINSSGKIPVASLDQAVYNPSNLTGINGISISQIPSPAIDAYTVGLYHFDDSLKDEITGNLASVIGNRYAYMAGKFSKGIYQTSNEFDTGISLNNSLDGTQSFTVDFWIYVNGSNSATLSLCYRNSIGAYGMTFDSSNKRIILNGYLAGGSDATITLEEFDSDTWYHVAYEQDMATGTLYLFFNGKNVWTKTGYSQLPLNIVRCTFYGTMYTSNILRLDEFRTSSICRWTSDFTPYDQPYGGDAQYTISYNGSGGSLTRKNYTGIIGTTLATGLTLSSFTTILVYKNGILFTETEDESDESDYDPNDYIISDNDIIFNVALEASDKVAIVAM